MTMNEGWKTRYSISEGGEALLLSLSCRVRTIVRTTSGASHHIAADAKSNGGDLQGRSELVVERGHHIFVVLSYE